MIRKREDEWCRCERGYALVLALICLAVLAMLAAFYAARITTQSRCSAHLFVALQNELLAFSAEEEARMVLALGDGGIERAPLWL